MIRVKLGILRRSFDPRSFDSYRKIKIILNEGFAGKKLLTKKELAKRGWKGDDFTFRKSLINLLNQHKPVDTFDRNMGLPGLINSYDTGYTAPTQHHEEIYEGITKTGEKITFSIDPVHGIFDLHLPNDRVIQVPSHIDKQIISGRRVLRIPERSLVKLYLDWEKMLEDNIDILDFFNTSPEKMLGGRGRPNGPFLK